MNAVPLHRPGALHDQAWSWAVSLFLHGLAIAAAIVLVADLRLAPQPEPFRWVVSRIEPQTQADASAAARSPRPAQDQPASASRSDEARTAASTVEPPPPAQAIVRRNVPEVTQPLQPAPEPIQAQRQPVEPTLSPTPFIPQQTRSQTTRPTEAPPIERDTAQPPMPVEAPGREPARPRSEAIPQQTAPAAYQAIDATAASPHEATESHQAQERHPLTPAAEGGPALPESATVASLAPTPQADPASPSGPVARPKTDYGWLAGAIRAQVEQLKHYPHLARANRWEGRVVLRAVIGEEGQLVDLKIAESSGHSILDEAALAVLKKAAPLTLPQPLGRPQVVVQVPINYKLR